ncbi:MAG TPA: hypothetical protein VGC53_01185 [Vicinamibacteria bacterium]
MTPRRHGPIYRLRSQLCTRFLFVVFLLSLARPGSVWAWPAPIYRNMVYDTLLIMPPAMRRVLWRNQEHLLKGVTGLEGEMASALARDALTGSISEDTARAIEQRVHGAADQVNQRRPFSEVAVELGKLLRIAADLADPTFIGAGDPQLARASGEFHRFVTLHLDEFPLVYDWTLPSTVEGASVRALLGSLTAASRDSVPLLTSAFWRQGELVPAEAFDYRSVPYASASLSYSRGVTAASYLWLSAWKEANGDFTGYKFYRNGEQD